MNYVAKKISHIWHHTRKRRLASVLLLLFALTNVGVYFAYRDKTYPDTTINGQVVGSIRYEMLPERIRSLPLLPAEITLSNDGAATTVSPAAIGLGVDEAQTVQYLREKQVWWQWLPLVNLYRAPDVPIYIAVEPSVYQKKIVDISTKYKQESVQASLVQRGGDFIIIPEVDALVIDASGTQARLIEALSTSAAGKKSLSVALAMKKTPPTVTRASLGPALSSLQAQRNSSITVTHQEKAKKFTADEIGGWFVRTGPQFTLSATKVSDAITDAGLELSASVTNVTEVASIVRQSVEAKKAVSVSLAGAPIGKKAITYCTALRGVPDSEMAGFSSKAAATLNAKRGWALGGNISFTKTDATCDFTLWLTAADQMPSFGAICDPMWSCAVTPNVVINYDRWKGASESWNKDGGSLEDYRVMVINHEVGHWLGFDHSKCPGAGQSAPVMLQQSIDLQGCSFSPWPSTTERVALRNYLGL